MPFEKGKSGNPNGRPKGKKAFGEMLKLALNAPLDEHGNKLRGVAEKLVTLALNGEEWAIKEVADRIDGKVAQSVVGDEDGPPVKVHQVIERIIRKPDAD